uniref:S1-like domain-containing protein n=1 Tax=Arundo donax TaxID=35708 RepID=A0A0A9DA69_ARUDO
MLGEGKTGTLLGSSTRGRMKAGRKNLRRARDEGAAVTLAEGESIMQVLALRGSNVIEGVKSLALFPAKFQKSFWIKNGSFVVVDASGREQALESGSKIACVVSQVLFHDQVRALEKSDEWPAIFKSTPNEGSEAGTQGPTAQIDEEPNSDEDDDDLPPLEVNTNRNRPFELHSDSDSGSDS